MGDRRTRGLDALVLLVWAPLALRHWTVTEDAFISYRYAANWAHGLGLRFNPGDPPIEGFSNLLIVALAAACERVGLPPERVVPVVTLACGAAVLLGTLAVARRVLGVSEASSRWAVLALGVLPSFAAWSTSGLEPMPQTLLFLVTATGLAFAETPRVQWATALAGLLLAAIRTEGALWSPVLVAVGIVVRWAERRPIAPTIARYAAVVVPGVAALLAFRLLTFGTLVSNVARTKLAPLPIALPRGLAYVTTFALLVGWAVPVLLVSLGAARRPRVAWALALALAVIAWAVLVGGDYLAWFRFLVPALPFLALLLGVALDRVRARAPRPVVVALSLVVVLVGFLPDVGVTPVPDAWLRRFDTTTPNRAEADVGEARFVRGRLVVAGAQRKLAWEARALGAFAHPGDVVVTGAVGLAGYRNPELVLLDLCGLVTRPPRLGARTARERPGHDACTGPLAFLARDPDVLVFAAAYGRHARATIRADVARWRQRYPVDRYAPDLVVLEADGVPGGIFVGYGLRKVTDAAARWAAFDARIDAVASTGR